jgi:hypothetical protein
MDTGQRLSQIEAEVKESKKTVESVLMRMDKGTDATYKLISKLDLLVHKFDKVEVVVDELVVKMRAVEDNQLVNKSAWTTFAWAKRSFIGLIVGTVFGAIVYVIKLQG